MSKKAIDVRANISIESFVRNFARYSVSSYDEMVAVAYVAIYVIENHFNKVMLLNRLGLTAR